MIRMGSVIGLRPEKIAEYKALHARAWPGVIKTISACNIRNYVIYLREPENLLFSHFEYHGADWAADQAKMAADPVTREWWALCEPCQRKMDSAREGEWWAPMEEVFFHE